MVEIMLPVVLEKECSKSTIRCVNAKEYIAFDHCLMDVSSSTEVVKYVMPPEVFCVDNEIALSTIQDSLCQNINPLPIKCFLLVLYSNSDEISMSWRDCSEYVLLW